MVTFWGNLKKMFNLASRRFSFLLSEEFSYFFGHFVISGVDYLLDKMHLGCYSTVSVDDNLLHKKICNRLVVANIKASLE